MTPDMGTLGAQTVDISEVRRKYGNKWEIFPGLVNGVAAARRNQTMGVGDYQRGVQVALIARSLDELAAKLAQQDAIDRGK
ncbi:hypothetical protein [Nonomuraea typhae]|uniref:Uncharacterized protein n=1 Tax=Nonomuraea typhae TaxID=2603600 RepID=A0ABW7YJV6_9ACTN